MAGLKVLVFNAGSTSFKASLYEIDEAADEGSAPVGLLWEDASGSSDGLTKQLATLWSGPKKILGGPGEIDCIGHRVVFGGARLISTTRVDAEVHAHLAEMDEYAPAHNDAALVGMDAATRIFGDAIPQFAVFDSAFHRSMPAAAYTYAGPSAWVEQGIRRYGFHGLSHRYTSHRAARLMNRAGGLRIVTCHLGGGCSLAAVHDGKSVDTTMGFTPLDGIPMARRSGTLDPGILIHLLRHGGKTVDEIDHLLNHDSGLAGLSGTSGGMREVLAAVDNADDRAVVALEVFVHRVRQGIASMAASMGGIDGLVFSGGVGENSDRVRSLICSGLFFLGITLDELKNETSKGERAISADGSAVPVFVIPAEENWIIAQECLRAS